MTRPRLSAGLLGLALAALAPAASGQALFRDASATHLPPPLGVSQNSMDVAAVDLDGDGDPDLVIASEFQTNVLLINDGSGHFTDGSAGLGALPASEVPGPAPPAHDTEDVAAEDFDGDGHVDLVFVSEDDVRHGRTDVHEYYRGRGDGTFERVYGVLPDTEANAIEAFDADGDGRLDLVISGAGQDRLLLGDGRGGFTDATDRLPPDDAVGQDVESVDVDGDGDPDLVVGNEGGHRLWLNDGAGRFTDATAGRLPDPGNVEARKVTPVDVDGDGDADLYFAHVGWQGRQPQDRLYLNDGTGHFADATLDRIGVEAETTADATFADLDGDGDLDLVRVNLGPLQVLLNDGTGRFPSETVDPAPGAVGVLPEAIRGSGVGVEVFDADGDGRLDLYVALLAGPAYDGAGLDRLLLGVAPSVAATPPVPAPAAPGARIVLVVRHAEPEPDGTSDPGLGEAGRQRAAALAALAAEHGVASVYVTPFRRTQETAAAAAERLGLAVEAVPVGPGGLDAHLTDLAGRVRQASGNVLVVGHSNTVPALVAELVGRPVAPIREAEFDRVFVVTLPVSGPPTLTEHRY